MHRGKFVAFTIDFESTLLLHKTVVENPLVLESATTGARFQLEGAHDPDVGLNDLHSYKLSQNAFFRLETESFGENDKIPFLVLQRSLDREHVAEIKLQLAAVDGGKPQNSGVLNIEDVNDNSPLFSQSPYTFYVTENNKPGASIFSVSANDVDEGDNARVSYSLDRTGPGQGITSFLSINEENGTIYALKSFDFESVKTFRFHVIAKDSGRPPLASNVKVNRMNRLY
uniref:Cadherin domain-containing protein n=1 Tax=Denticeps clupeoides TaxID=299321 RepID=A0AAY4DHQ2_9TELE